MKPDEFKKLVLPYGKKLFHFARLLLKDDYAAQDAVQEVYLKLWKMHDELKKVHNPEAFMLKMTKNWCLDRIKSKKPVLLENYTPVIDHHSEDNEPHKVLERKEKVKILYQILDKMPEQQKILIKLRDIDGYELNEITDITGMNDVTVRVNLSRARKKIREELIKIDSYGFEKSRTTG